MGSSHQSPVVLRVRRQGTAPQTPTMAAPAMPTATPMSRRTLTMLALAPMLTLAVYVGWQLVGEMNEPVMKDASVLTQIQPPLTVTPNPPAAPARITTASRFEMATGDEVPVVRQATAIEESP